MRITEMAEQKVLQALKNNGVFGIEMESMDHEVIPVASPAPPAEDGRPEFLLSLLIFLAVPTVAGNDRVEQYGTVRYPHSPQMEYDKVIGKILERIRKERDGDVPQGLAGDRSAAGLFLGH